MNYGTQGHCQGLHLGQGHSQLTKHVLVTTPGKTLAVVVVGVSSELAAPERLEGGGGAGKE